MKSEADAFARLAHELHDQTNVEQTLAKIVESAVAVVGCDHAGVLLTRKGSQVDAIIASHPIAEKADKLQIELHEGPGIVAVADTCTTLVTNTATDRRSLRPACLNRAIQCHTRGVIVAGHRRPHTHRPGPRHPHGTVRP